VIFTGVLTFRTSDVDKKNTPILCYTQLFVFVFYIIEGSDSIHNSFYFIYRNIRTLSRARMSSFNLDCLERGSVHALIVVPY
jgi:hypothetical protein